MDENSKARIKQVLVEKIRPMLAADGGDVELVEVTDDGTVKVRLTGGCIGCPLAGLTLSMGVERVLKQEVPDVSKVELAD